MLWDVTTTCMMLGKDNFSQKRNLLITNVNLSLSSSFTVLGST